MEEKINEVKQGYVVIAIKENGIKIIKIKFLNKSMSIKDKIKTKGKSGSIGGKYQEDYVHQENSKNSLEPTNSSKKYWQTPKDAKELAKQALEVGALVLNDEIDLEKARTYSSVVRVTTQVITAEVNTARMKGIIPDLTL